MGLFDVFRKIFKPKATKGKLSSASLEKELPKLIKGKYWQQYANNLWMIARIKAKQGKQSEALKIYLEECYLSINGPFDVGSMGKASPELLKQYPEFNPRNGDFAPGVLDGLLQIVESQNISYAELKDQFLTLVNRLPYRKKCPLKPETCWNKLQRELKSFGKAS